MPSARGLEPGDTAADFKLRNARSFVIEEKHSDPLKNSFKPVHMTLEQTIGETGGVIMFTCNHCPYVIHYHKEIKRFANDFENDINIVAISSNDIVNFPQDRPEMMKSLWNDLDLIFPYLFDETQEVAKKYKAECTPEFYLFDTNLKLVYRGRMDESSPGSSIQPSGGDLRNAINNILENKEISKKQFPSMGCNIKWK